jgi:hypothetical protein
LELRKKKEEEEKEGEKILGKRIIYPHFHQKGCMNDQYEDWKKGIGLAGDERRTLLEEDQIIPNLPLINFLDARSIRSVGAFNKCTYQFGQETFNGF